MNVVLAVSWSICLVVASGSAQSAYAQSLRKDVVHLSSEALEGREVGTAGHDLARDYVTTQMKEAGLEPAGADGTWWMPVTIVRRARPSTDTSLRVGEALLARGVGYQVADFSDEAAFDGSPLFVGYGLTVRGWDDYADVDVEGRIVFAFTGAPRRVLDQLREEDRYLLGEASKAAVALAKGARAIIFVQDPRTHGDRTEQRPDELPRLRPALPLRGIAAGYVTARRARELISPAGLDVEEYQQSLEAAPRAVELPIVVSGVFRLEREMVVAHNVVGCIDGTTDEPSVALGAHYDHLGVDGPGSRWDGPEALHPGADDNASGVAVLLSAARALAKSPPPRRTILFVATTGEELGLRGARQASLLLRGTQPGVYVNLDMVGRLRDSTLRTFGVDAHPTLLPTIETAAREAGLTLDHQPLSQSQSDHIAFAERGWSAVSLSTGRHADYHLPSDTVKHIDWRGLARVDLFVRTLVTQLADEPARQ